MEILIKRLHEEAKLPAYESEAGPGIDLYALHEVTITPGQRVTIPTGVAMAMPVGYVGLIWGENAMVTKDTIKVTHSFVDSGYRDEIEVELLNTSSEPRTFVAGERIAQLLVQHIHHAHLIQAEDLGGVETV
ncbi:dUTP diphosphatase [Candidatus Kaiserbacteria bacterium]|nr:dUTP diphosphatase [Candidatus Kaiserbacteria bacterium]USN89051.1 MAG: dUTP diphosphatase [Candidatus Nomurabacteria bacterium]